MADADLFVRPSIRDVLTQVSDGATIAPATEEAVRAALVKMTSGRMPWYLRVLIGAGAWIGASFLLSAILSLILLASGEVAQPVSIVIGIIFIAGSIPFRRRVTAPFATQLALVVSSTGQILVIGGFGSLDRSFVDACLAAIVSSLVLIALFPDRIQRFSATVVVFYALATIVMDQRIPQGIEAVALLALVLLLALWRFTPRAIVEAHAELVEPIVYGIVVALLTMLLIDLFFTFDANEHELIWGGLTYLSDVAFTIAMLALAVMIFREHGVSLARPEAVGALVGIVALGVITKSTPGVMATLLLLVLGFDRRARGLIVMGTVFFLVFGAVFYYVMNLTLLQKSGILTLSGVLCLAAWAVVRRRG
jgi:uncharacterized membrane protein